MKRLISILGFTSLLFVTELVAQDAPEDEPESPDAVEMETDEEPVKEKITPVPSRSILDENVIPEPYAEARYKDSWSKNPFLRETIKIEGPKVDWSQDWALAGMYRSQSGKIIVSLQNKQTGDFKRVTNEDDANSEFQLVQANFNRNRSEASVELSKDGKKATVKFDDNLTSRPLTVSNTFKSPQQGQPGAPGNPNIRPGQPGQPGQQPNPNLRTPGAQPINVTQQPQGIMPGVQPQPPPGAAPAPQISRRRQLIPTPPPQSAPQQ